MVKIVQYGRRDTKKKKKTYRDGEDHQNENIGQNPTASIGLQGNKGGGWTSVRRGGKKKWLTTENRQSSSQNCILSLNAIRYLFRERWCGAGGGVGHNLYTADLSHYLHPNKNLPPSP